MAFHMTGMYQVYDRYMSNGIYLVYTEHCRMSDIYQVFTIIINFLRFPDGRAGHRRAVTGVQAEP
jgi:hypothetical protein